MSRLKCVLPTVAAAVSLAGWAEDPPDLPAGFTLSDTLRFVNEIDSSECQLLRFEGGSLGNVATVMRAGDNLVLEQCEIHGPWRSEDGNRLGGWARGWFLAQPGGAELQLIELEGIDIFSSPKPCGDRIAYWVSKDLPGSRPEADYFAYVANLVTNEILERHNLGEAWVATDYKFYFPFPEWDGNCSAVLSVRTPTSSPSSCDFPPPIRPDREGLKPGLGVTSDQWRRGANENGVSSSRVWIVETRCHSVQPWRSGLPHGVPHHLNPHTRETNNRPRRAVPTNHCSPLFSGHLRRFSASLIVDTSRFANRVLATVRTGTGWYFNLVTASRDTVRSPWAVPSRPWRAMSWTARCQIFSPTPTRE